MLVQSVTLLPCVFVCVVVIVCNYVRACMRGVHVCVCVRAYVCACVRATVIVIVYVVSPHMARENHNRNPTLPPSQTLEHDCDSVHGRASHPLPRACWKHRSAWTLLETRAPACPLRVMNGCCGLWTVARFLNTSSSLHFAHDEMLVGTLTLFKPSLLSACSGRLLGTSTLF